MIEFLLFLIALPVILFLIYILGTLLLWPLYGILIAGGFLLDGLDKLLKLAIGEDRYARFVVWLDKKVPDAK